MCKSAWGVYSFRAFSCFFFFSVRVHSSLHGGCGCVGFHSTEIKIQRDYTAISLVSGILMFGRWVK